MRKENNNIQSVLRIIAAPFVLAILIALFSVGQLSATADMAIGQAPRMVVNQEMAVICTIAAFLIGVLVFCKRHRKDRNAELKYIVDNEDVEI
jgi:hypothetical protein